MKNGHESRNQHHAVQPYIPRDMPPSPYFSTYREPEPQQEFHLRDYLSVIMKRKKLVTVFLLSVVITTLVLSLMTVPVYQASVVIKIDKRGSNASTFSGLNFSGMGDDYYMTQYEILKSRSLAEKVIRKLDLVSNEKFMPVDGFFDRLLRLPSRIINKSTRYVTAFFAPKDREKAANQSADAASPDIPINVSNALISRLSVLPVKNSQLVRVSFECNNAKLATSVTNAVAAAFIEYDLESRVNADKQAKEFLAQQIKEAESKVNHSENALNSYASRHEIVYLDNGNQSVLTRKLSEISSDLNRLTSERMQKEALLRQIRESGSDNPIILNNPLVQGLTREHANIEAEYFNLSKTFTPDYPKMKNLKSQMDAIQKRIESEKNNIISSLESDYHAAQKKENYLKNAFDSHQKKVLSFQERAIEYETLKREVEVNKELHNSLLKKLSEVSVAAMSTATNIQVVDKAMYPKNPYKPDIPMNFLLSLVFGLFGGIGLAFFVDYFDSTVKDTEDIERSMNLPSLGMIPFQKDLNAETRPLLLNRGASNNLVSEAFRSIGTFLLLSTSSRPPKTILITSANEKEGKTTISLNIASALTESLGKGIIIDADMRRPKIYRSLGVDNKIGLSSFLSGNYELKDDDNVLIKDTPIKGLSVISAGPQPPNPSELLHSERMKELLNALYGMFSFIIIDAPPIMGTPDSVLLSSMVDGTVLVVRAGETSKASLSAVKQTFRHVNAKLLGVVLNGVKKEDLKYGYYSHYFSSYFKE